MSEISQEQLAREESFANDVERAQIRLVKVVEVFIGAGIEPYVHVKPIYQRRYLNEEGDPEFTEGAEVWDVPILYDSNQSYANWSPPQVDDTGLLIQTDQPFDLWWETGEFDLEPNNSRKRNRSDGFFLPAGWAKVKFMDQASVEWHEMRNMENDLRVAINNDQGTHLQHKLNNLMLSQQGFDVLALNSVSLMQNLISGFTALAAENTLTNRSAYAAVAAQLSLIYGGVQAPVRPPAAKVRP